MASSIGRDIPLPLKREVRQRCGFGCVICGTPLIEYHHMTPWETVQEHTADNLTLLCPNHHKEATEPNASISEAQVRQYDAESFNLKAGWSAARKLLYRDPVPIQVGPSFAYEPVEGSFAVLAIDGFPLLGFRLDQGHLLLNFDLRDERNRRIVMIDDNEVTFDATLWDVEWVSNLLTVRRNFGDVALRIRFASDAVQIERAVVRLNGAELTVTDNGLSTDGQSTIAITGSSTSLIGANFGAPPAGIRPGLQYTPLPRRNGYCQRTSDATGDIRQFLHDRGAPDPVGMDGMLRPVEWADPVQLNTALLDSRLQPRIDGEPG